MIRFETYWSVLGSFGCFGSILLKFFGRVWTLLEIFGRCGTLYDVLGFFGMFRDVLRDILGHSWMFWGVSGCEIKTFGAQKTSDAHKLLVPK